MKVQIFYALCMNTAIYGCESWTLTKDIESKLTVFYHKALRSILDVNMTRVKEQRIRNEHIRNKVSLPDIVDIVRFRQFNYLGKLAQQPNDYLARRMLGAWIPCRRKRGRAQRSLKNQYAETLQTVLGEQAISNNCLFSEWMPLARNPRDWKDLGQDWLNSRHLQTRHDYGDHPALGQPVRVL